MAKQALGVYGTNFHHRVDSRSHILHYPQVPMVETELMEVMGYKQRPTGQNCVVAVLSFVCSIGNVPLAGVLWNGGISFGGVVAFIFADLLILPILNIYRKYYGWRMALYLTGTFYLAMVAAGWACCLTGSTG